MYKKLSDQPINQRRQRLYKRRLTLNDTFIIRHMTINDYVYVLSNREIIQVKVFCSRMRKPTTQPLAN